MERASPRSRSSRRGNRFEVTVPAMRLTTSGARFVREQSSPWWAAAVTIVALLLVFVLDRATDATPFQHLYYLPIIFAGVNFEIAGGIGAAVLAIGLYHLANPHLLTFRYGEYDVVQMALFLAVGVITAKLTSDAERLHRLAMTDDLTGLHNLRSFEQRLAAMVVESNHANRPLALLVLDVDRLKSVNDQYGHLAGAESVRTVGHIIGRRLPPLAVACRYGGDEFVIAIPDCTAAVARRVAEDLCRVVHETAPALAGHSFGPGYLSISVGVACSMPGEGGPAARQGGNIDAGEALFREADAALYRSKAAGRNRVSVA